MLRYLNVKKPEMIKILHKTASTFWKIVKPVTVGVRILLLKNDEILLVKHTYSESWFLPGGGLKKGETFQQGIERELKEELEITVTELELHGVYNNFFEGKNDSIIVFLSENFSEPTKKDREIEHFGYFKLNDLPPKTSPGTKNRIAEFLNGITNNYGSW